MPKWLGWQDLNLRVRESKSLALPLGYTPVYLFENGAFEEIRTPDPRLRRAMLYPTELQTHIMERVMGIGPTQPAWKAGTLPLSYTRNALILPHLNLLVNY